jgi:hypothetical protein
MRQSPLLPLLGCVLAAGILVLDIDAVPGAPSAREADPAHGAVPDARLAPAEAFADLRPSEMVAPHERSSGSDTREGAPRGGSAVPAADRPCAVRASRAVSPLVVPEQTEVRSTIRFGFECPTGQRRLNLFILQNSGATGTVIGEEGLNANFRSAMQSFIETIDPLSGTRLGYMTFSTGATTQVPLTALDAWPSTWGSTLSSTSPTSGLLKAMRGAAAALPADAAEHGAENAILIVLSGTDSIGSMADKQSACAAVRAVHARVGALSMYGPSNNGTLHDFPCVDYLVRSAEQDGSDLADAFGAVQEGLLDATQVESVEVYDGQTDAFAYVQGSGSPHEPDTAFGGELTWSFPAPDAGENTVGYRLLANPGWTDVMARASREARVTFFFTDGSQAPIVVDNPTVCIHRRRDDAFCSRPTPAPVLLPSLRRGFGE